MPEKDGSEDKKSTKSVVNKKQKQFMNQEEQLDLSSVAESFGGQIVGEPVELDEGVVSFTARTAKFLKSKPGRTVFKRFVDLGRKYKGKIKNYLTVKKLNKTFKKSKDFNVIGGPDYYTRIPKPPIKEPFKPLKPLKDFIRTGTEKAKTQFSKIKDALRPKKKTKNRYDTYVDDLLKGNKGKNMGKNK